MQFHLKRHGTELAFDKFIKSMEFYREHRIYISIKQRTGCDIEY